MIIWYPNIFWGLAGGINRESLSFERKRPCIKTITLSWTVSRHCHPSVLVSPAKSILKIHNSTYTTCQSCFSQKGSAPRSIHFHPELLTDHWGVHQNWNGGKLNMHFLTCSFGSKFPFSFGDSDVIPFQWVEALDFRWSSKVSNYSSMIFKRELIDLWNQKTLFLLDGVYIYIII